jgi:PAS domain S-box-containing protein
MLSQNRALSQPPKNSPGLGELLLHRLLRRRPYVTASLLASIVESSDDGIYSMDLDGIITSWNKGAEQLFGYTAAEAVGTPLAKLIPLDRQDEEIAILERIKCGERIHQGVTQVAVLRDTSSSGGIGQFAVIQAVAPSLGLEVSTINVGDPGEMDRAVTEFAREPNGGLIVTAAPSTMVHRDLIIGLAARHKLPVVYFDRTHVADGGLVSYGPDLVSQFRQAASYVDRILRGEKPADLPVQAPNKYELVINLKTAKALGLTIPPSVLGRADEVIE